MADRPGASALFIDHRLDRLLPMIDRVELLDGEGRLVASAPPAELFHDHRAAVAATGSWQPLAAELFGFLRDARLELAERPLTMGEVPAILSHVARASSAMLRDRLVALVGQWLVARRCVLSAASGRWAAARRGHRLCPARRPQPSRRRRSGDSRRRNPRHRRGQWRGQVDPWAHSRRAVASQARDGSTTPARRRRAAFLFQNPEHQFLAVTVAGELAASLADEGLPVDASRERLDDGARSPRAAG